jgi:hypothetical protein
MTQSARFHDQSGFLRLPHLIPSVLSLAQMLTTGKKGAMNTADGLLLIMSANGGHMTITGPGAMAKVGKYLLNRDVLSEADHSVVKKGNQMLLTVFDARVYAGIEALREQGPPL